MSVTVDRPVAVGIAAVVAAVIAGIAALPWLPAEMAIHFSATGTPGTYVPSMVGIAVVPVTMVVALPVLNAAFRVDPPERERTAVTVTAAVFALLLALHLLVLGWNLGYGVPFEFVFAGALLWGAVVTAYALAVEYRS